MGAAEQATEEWNAPSITASADLTQQKDGVLAEASWLRGGRELETIFFGACQAVQ